MLGGSYVMLSRKSEFLEHADLLLRWMLDVDTAHDVFGMLEELPRVPHYQLVLDGTRNSVELKAFNTTIVHRERRVLLSDTFDIQGQRLRTLGCTAARLSRLLDESCLYYTPIARLLNAVVEGNRVVFYFNALEHATTLAWVAYQNTPSGRPIDNVLVEQHHTTPADDVEHEAYQAWLEEEAALGDLFSQCHREGRGDALRVGYYTLNELRCITQHSGAILRKPHLLSYIAFTGVSLTTGQAVPGLAITQDGENWTYVIRTVTPEFQPLTLRFHDAVWHQTHRCSEHDVALALGVPDYTHTARAVSV